MKKILSLLIIPLLLLSGCGAAPTVLEQPPSTVLVSIDGESVMTVEDLSQLVVQQEISSDIKGTALKEEKQLFLEASETRILSYFAVQFGLEEDKQSLEKTFDEHMEEIADTDVYGQEKLFSDTLQKALDMSEQEYRTWTINQSFVANSAENLIADIAATYRNISDPIEMEESILKNLEALAEIYDIEVNYPGVPANKTSFQYIF